MQRLQINEVIDKYKHTVTYKYTHKAILEYTYKHPQPHTNKVTQSHTNRNWAMPILCASYAVLAV